MPLPAALYMIVGIPFRKTRRWLPESFLEGTVGSLGRGEKLRAVGQRRGKEGARGSDTHREEVRAGHREAARSDLGHHPLAVPFHCFQSVPAQFAPLHQPQHMQHPQPRQHPQHPVPTATAPPTPEGSGTRFLGCVEVPIPLWDAWTWGRE